jgi:UDP-N-acetylglucosamine kinase
MLDERQVDAAFSALDVTLLVQRELTLTLGRCQAQEQPRAILLAGQPGAGKTELSTMMISQLDGDAAFINADDYRRYHPNYRKLYAEYGSDVVSLTSAFSSAVTEQLIKQLSDAKVNLVIEGTGRTVEVPRTTAERLETKGYRVEIAVIAARPEVSLTSTLLRFCRMNEGGTIPRATALEAHDKVVSVLPDNLDVLRMTPSIAEIRIWDRNLRQLYDSETNAGTPAEALTEYWHSPWNKAELESVQEQIIALQQDAQLRALGQEAVLDELIRRIENTRKISDATTESL